MFFRATQRDSNQGLGTASNTTPEVGDNEYDAYRKRMMLAYRFRPNPLVNISFSFFFFYLLTLIFLPSFFNSRIIHGELTTNVPFSSNETIVEH